MESTQHTSPVLMAAVAGMFVSALLGRDSALIACSSVAALQFGKALPVKVLAGYINIYLYIYISIYLYIYISISIYIYIYIYI
jgi:hypothetical protein